MEQKIQRHTSKICMESSWPGNSEQCLLGWVGEDRDLFWTGA